MFRVGSVIKILSLQRGEQRISEIAVEKNLKFVLAYLETFRSLKMNFPCSMDKELYATKIPRSIRPWVAEINSLKVTNELHILEKC